MDTETISLLMRDSNRQVTYEFDSRNYGRKRSAEELLLIAVLEDAIERIQGVITPGVSRERSDLGRKKDIAWCKSDAHDWPFTFVNVCDALDLDSSAVRQQILRWLKAYGKRKAA